MFRSIQIFVVFCVACLSGVGLAEATVASGDTFGTGIDTFTIDFVNISGATNPTDTTRSAGYGIVNHDYRMGTYEITYDQWSKFRVIYGPVTGSDGGYVGDLSHGGGINGPAYNVNWYGAAQFVNWLNTSTNHQAAYKFTGAQGTSNYTFEAWAPSDYGYNANNPFRNSNAFYFLPTEDEWVKAAYWNGTELQTYATKAGEILTQGNGTSGTGWNYKSDDGNWYHPWSVGSGSQELNGTYDMMGNAYEWEESPFTSGDYGTRSVRGMRGGDTGSFHYILSVSYRYGYPPSIGGDFNAGFRVASVPEPSTLILLGMGAIGVLAWAWRRRRA